MTAVIFAGLFFLDSRTPAAAERVFYFGVPAAALLSLCLTVFRDNEAFQKTPFRQITFLGNISYSLYLTHYFVVKFVERAVNFRTDRLFLKIGMAVVTVGVCVAVAYIAFCLFERKLTEKIKKKTMVTG